MRSLKRSATSYLDQAVGHKRKCSNPSSRPSTTPTHDNNTDAPLKFQRRKPAQHMLHAEVPVHCIHKHASACALLMKICCSCADKRPITHAYPMYVDGRGIGPSDDRSLHYCFGCQAYWGRRRSHPEHNVPSLPSLGLTEAESTCDHIRVCCDNRTFDFVRSGDYNLEQLRHEVSLLMRCNASDISVMASDSGLSMASESSVHDAAGQIQFSVNYTADVEMCDA
ncbi:hypothetical protein HBI56_072850 [Parastagonospora nodorum]|nr:hypothetical protein HBH56_172130 [Parastagonospora nodorum]QRC94580.1 hypothetical protein JI435_078080 [Parastagonospora nodorum SN15]KAH3928407.1 hypothetical protein HBH54_140690 [Parastagonospora nodorum]KAH3945310.1 hypothetical protein HBH53_146010 [Parastagonospora nodorum]KAH3983709.1 hypothetical protein HBH52_058180 [Parastagonospora nodorum]